MWYNTLLLLLGGGSSLTGVDKKRAVISLTSVYPYFKPVLWDNQDMDIKHMKQTRGDEDKTLGKIKSEWSHNKEVMNTARVPQTLLLNLVCWDFIIVIYWLIYLVI